MHRMIDTGTWDDPWFAELEPDAKLVFLYLITNRRSTAAGAFEITLRAMAFETGLQQSRIEAILNGFGERVQWWPAYQVVWIRNFFKRQAANDNFTKSAQRYVMDLPAEVQRAIALVYPMLVTADLSGVEGTGTDTPEVPIPTGIGTRSAVIVESSSSNSEVGEEGGRDERAAGGGAPPRPPQPVPKPKPTRLPNDFTVTDQMHEWATNAGASQKLIEYETEQFRDYWCAVPGNRGVKLDWPATWRKWLRKAIDEAPSSGALTLHRGSKPSPVEISMSEADKVRIENGWALKHSPSPPDDVIETTARRTS
jgi:hypothetical protein